MKAKKIVARVILVGSLFFIFGFSGALYIDLEKPENTHIWNISQLDVSFGSQAYAESGGRESGKKSSKKKYKKESGRKKSGKQYESGKYENTQTLEQEIIIPETEYIIGSYSEIGDLQTLYSYGVELEVKKGKIQRIALVDYPKNPYDSLSQSDIETAFAEVVSEKSYNLFSLLGENKDAYGLQKALDSGLKKANIAQSYDVEARKTIQKKEEIQKKAEKIGLILDEKIVASGNQSKKKYQIIHDTLKKFLEKAQKDSESFVLIEDVLAILEQDVTKIVKEVPKQENTSLSYEAPNGSKYLVFQGPDGNYRFQRENKTIGDISFSSRENTIAYIDTNAVATAKNEVSSSVSSPTVPPAPTPAPVPKPAVTPAPAPKPVPKPTVQVVKPTPAPAPTYKKVDKKTRAS